MRHLFDRRIVFFGGKGGVGKTTCSAATALEASRRGRRVLLVSTDPAHSTSDIFERQLTAEEREIQPGLVGLEIDADHEARRYLDAAKSRLAGLFSPAVVREAARQMELAAMMPGLAEVALFDRIGEIVRSRADAYDFIVFDTAPTGHTLRLLQMPELMEGWLRALRERRTASVDAAQRARLGTAGGGPETPPDPGSAASFSGQIASKTPPDPVVDPVVRVLEERAERLAAVRTRLTDRAVTGIALVLVPERLPIEETARAAHLLAQASLDVAGVIVNRVLPDGLEGQFFESRKRQERQYLDEIERRFSAWPRQPIPQLERDVYGLVQLERVARHLFG